MKKIKRIKELLELNYNLKMKKYDYRPETRNELIKIVEEIIKRYGNKADLNNIDVYNINNFEGIFSSKHFFNGYVSEWDVCNGKNFSKIFFLCTVFNDDLSKRDVSNGKEFCLAFDFCKNFNSDLSEWNVSNGKHFVFMFKSCKNFNSDLSKWDVSGGKDFTEMFYCCENFNADLSGWNVLNAIRWFNFCRYSLLEKYPERIPEKFRDDYL